MSDLISSKVIDKYGQTPAFGIPTPSLHILLEEVNPMSERYRELEDELAGREFMYDRSEDPDYSERDEYDDTDYPHNPQNPTCPGRVSSVFVTTLTALTSMTWPSRATIHDLHS